MRHRLFAAARLAAPVVATGLERTVTGADHLGRTASTPWRRTIHPAEQSILLSPRAIPGSLFSFESLLLLYMFAGIYKGDPRFAWIPVDPTGLFFALSVVVGAFIIVLNPIPKRALPLIFAMFAFAVWWAVTLTWSPSRVYGPAKVFYLLTLTSWGLTAAALIIAPDPQRVRRLFTLILLLAICVAFDVSWIYRENLDEIFLSSAKDEESYLGGYHHIGRISGLGALVAFTAWLFGRHTSLVNLLHLVPFAGLAFVVTVTGAKMSVLATVVPILLALLLALRLTKRKILYRRYGIATICLVSALIVGISIYVAATDHTPKSIQRLIGMVEGGVLQGTAASRARDYEHVFEFLGEAPLLGRGAGSWTILEHRLDERDSPHNQFLEVLLETGFIGLVLLLILFAVALRPISLERLRNDPFGLCAFMLFVHAFITAQLGGDVAESRVMWMLLGLLTLFTVRREATRSATAPAHGVTGEAAKEGRCVAMTRRPPTDPSSRALR